MTSSRPRMYLVRHGETDWNAAGRLLSHTDEPLSAIGERQATGLAEGLASVVWDRAFGSPLVRARRTAEIVLASRADAPALVLDDRLVELDFGPFEGWAEAELAADRRTAAWRRDGTEVVGFETIASVQARARSFMADVLGSDGATLVVGHGRMLRILLTTALDLPLDFAALLRMRNCRPAIIEPGPRPLLLGFNVGSPADEARDGSRGSADAGARIP